MCKFVIEPCRIHSGQKEYGCCVLLSVVSSLPPPPPQLSLHLVNHVTCLPPGLSGLEEQRRGPQHTPTLLDSFDDTRITHTGICVLGT